MSQVSCSLVSPETRLPKITILSILCLNWHVDIKGRRCGFIKALSKDGLSKCLQSQTQYLGEKSTHHTKKKLHLQKEKTIINT